MTFLYYTRGLPASGKSTKAREMVAERMDYDLLVRINRDDIRSMLGTTTGQHEGFITILQDRMIDTALSSGHDVIVDDTNFFKGTDKRFRLLAEKHDAQTVLLDFTDVPLETCITRDFWRKDAVGEYVIRNMHDRYIGGK